MGTQSDAPLGRRVWLIGGLIVLALAAVVGVIMFTRQSAKPTQTAKQEQVAEREGEEEFGDPDAEQEGRARGGSAVSPEVVNAPLTGIVRVPAAAAGAWTPSVRMGFTAGDQWEPSIASDRSGHVYILYPQYGGVPGCPTCPDPTMTLMVSNDSGATWSAPTIFQPSGGNGQQWDAQIEVDPVDGSTVYASWMENAKSDIMVGKSTDFGQTWTAVRANSIKSGTDKPILAVRGQNVYVAYNHTNTIWISASHDGGQTYTTASVKTQNLGWSLPGGGTVTTDGKAYFSFNGFQKSGSATGPVNLYVVKSSDGGATWNLTQIDKSGPPPDCSAYACGWAYLGAQIVMTSDAANNLYLLWNGGPSGGGPERIYFSKSTNGGSSWSTKTEVSTAPVGVDHAFPAIAAGANGDVRISWMDNRNNHAGTPAWNVYYRTSTNGGSTWTAETDISTYVAGLDTYIWPEGFRYPFGDYFEMSIDGTGTTHAVWGQGFSYDSPGSIWYSKGR